MKFSQNDEEKYILGYFGSFIGTFCSIGENDGKTLSNVRALFERGWRGVMIEPDPAAYARLEDLYKGHKGGYCYKYAISNHNGKRVFHKSGELLHKGDIGLVSTFHAAEMDRFKNVLDYEAEEVKTFKWKTALNRWPIKKFDFISIDVEGDEMNILPDIDLSETKLLCIEWNSVPRLKTAYEKYLDGFRLIYTSGENLVYGR
jgi:FkbM family methyltransferase